MISDYAGSDWLVPHFGAQKTAVVAVNCSTPLCVLDAVSITSAGYPPDIPAIRVYAGRVSGATIFAGNSDTWSTHGVQDINGLPIGTWKMTKGAGWEMSGPVTQGNGHPTSALTFTVSGEVCSGISRSRLTMWFTSNH